MKRYYSFITLLLLGAGLVLLSRGTLDRDSVSSRPKRGEAGPFPSDQFMFQRLWPDRTIATAAYRAASDAAERVARRTLDDPSWIPAGPNNIGGRVSDIVGHPTNANQFYVAAASGGIFKTNDGGTNWTSIFDQSPSLSMGALAIDRAHPDTVYAGTGEACSAGFSYFGTGVYRTTDAGGSWVHLGLDESRFISRIAIDPANSQNVWVAAMGELYIESQERGIYRSTNAGQSWERALYVNDSTGASDVAVHPTNSQIVFAAMWQRIRTPQARIAGGVGSGIYRSVNGGESWQRLDGGLPEPAANIGRIGLSLCESNPNVIYACYADDPGNFLGVFKSIDGGENWGQVDDSQLAGIYSGFGWYFGNIRVRPDNPNIVFVMGVTMSRSTDGGQSWSNVSSSVHPDIHALWFHPPQPTRILLGHDGGVDLSTNNGNSWTFKPGLPINQFYAATVDYQHPQRRYGGTQDNGTLRTQTGGLNDWDHIHGGDGFYVLVDPTDGNRIYAEYQWGWLERSDDNGNGWMTVMDGIDGDERRNWSTPVAMSPFNPQTLYYGAERLYRSTNRGNNWAVVSPDLTDGGGSGNLDFGTITTIGLSRVNSQLIYVGTDDANVWCSTNGGGAWQNRSNGLPNRWITRVSPDPFDIATVYATISGFRNAETAAHLFRSTNYGVSWLNISSGLPDGPLNDIVPDSAVVGRLYVASDFGAFVTPDYGEHWYALGEDLPRVPMIQLVLHNQTRTLTAATYGRSMFTLNLAELSLNRMPVITGVEPSEIDTVEPPFLETFTVQAYDPDDLDSLVYRWLRNGDQISTSDEAVVDFVTQGVTEHIIVEVSDGDLIARHAWSIYVSGTAVDSPHEVPSSPLLLTSYPNPFNGDATLVYSVPTSGRITLKLYDLNGRLVRALYSGYHSAGEGRLNLSDGDLPTGTYFLSLETAHGSVRHKLLLLK